VIELRARAAANGYLQWLFLKRIFAGHTPFRLTALMTIGNILIGLGAFYYMRTLVGNGSGARASIFAEYGGGEGFMAVGVSMNAVLTVGLAAVARAIQDERSAGTLAYWMMCRQNILPMVLQSALGEFLLAGVSAFLTFFVLVGFWHIHFHTNVLSFLVVAAFSVVAVVGVGLAAAGVYVSGYSGTNPVIWAWGLTTSFLAGVYVPVQIFTDPILPVVTQIVPVTHALLAMRSAVLRNAPLTDPGLQVQLLYWALFSIVIAAAGSYYFQRQVRIAVQQGKFVDS